VELAGESKPVIARMAERGLLGVIAGTSVVRFLPALNTTRAEVDEAVRKFKEAL
jgi:acetylornithine/succinyldiaminopimelate/putrescine aminotransferase